MPYELRKFEDGNSFGYRVVNRFNGAWTSSEAMAQFVDDHYILIWKTISSPPTAFGVEEVRKRSIADEKISRKAHELLEEKMKEEEVIADLNTNSKT